MVKVKNISKFYYVKGNKNISVLDILLKRNCENNKRFWCLKNISFNIKENESLGIIGKNGSGKSTLLQIISKTLQPSEGTVYTDKNITSILELGSGFNDQLTGYENIKTTFRIWNRKNENINEEIKKIIVFSGLSEFINQPLYTYSTGMRVRLGFSICTIVKPKILVIDEALSVGDQLFQAKCIRKISELQKTGTTLILVSHSLDLIRRLCTKVIILDEGELIFEGTQNEGVKYYENLILRDIYDTDIKFQNRIDETLDLKANLLYCNLVDSENNIIKQTNEGDPLIIRVGIKHYQDLEDPHYGIRIVNHNGETVFGTTTYSNNIYKNKVHHGETVVVEFRIDNYLRKGFYNITVGCASNGIGFPYATWDELIFLKHEVYIFEIRQSDRGRWEGSSLLNTKIEFINN
jgi:lipopolysaccharide transport system ATP-binding protein